ncbi:hypothetical protein Tco_0376404, partial [Tanacetum coccineum]
ILVVSILETLLVRLWLMDTLYHGGSEKTCGTRYFTKGQKQSQTRQNRARNWKERKKLRPKVQKD